MSTEKCLSGTAIHHPLISDYSNAYMEFVASSTSDICVKYFWAWVKLSRINATNLPKSGLISPKTAGVSLYWVISCTKTDNLGGGVYSYLGDAHMETTHFKKGLP